MNKVIEELKPHHAADCAEIEKACFSEPWSKSEIEKLCTNSMAVYFVCLVDNRVVGYGGMYQVLDEGQINNIGVLIEYRRQGIADALIKSLVDYGRSSGLSRLILEVRASNLSAIALYEKNGFENIGIRKDFYSLPREDAIIMEKTY